MCGICGRLNFDPHDPVDPGFIAHMNAMMVHRGPDDSGIHVDANVGLGNQRLAIIDLTPAGHMPMSNEDGSIWITFNGELYNYPELTSQIRARGHIVRSHSDTEAILHLYEDYGTACLQYLRGMFAFAIWDYPHQRLFIARDRVGKKPLAYAIVNHSIIFASEIRCLLLDSRIPREPDLEAIHHFLTYQYVPAPLTAFKGIRKLPPAHSLVCEHGEIRIERYWDLNYSPRHNVSEAEWSARIRETLRESTKIRLMSDVPLGAFLSGGIDSSAVVATMSALSSERVKTFSIGFQDGGGFDETRYARVVAQRFNTEHQEFIVKPSAAEVLPVLVWHYGEPYADASAIPTYYLSKMTRQSVTVALNGDGGDESFAGYDRYIAHRALDKLAVFPASLRDWMSRAAQHLPESTDHKDWARRAKRFAAAAALTPDRRYGRLVSSFDDQGKFQLYSPALRDQLGQCDSFRILHDYYARALAQDPLARILYVDVMTYLPDDLLVKVDIASMAVSLEARSPFLDHKLMELAATIPSNLKVKGIISKYILKKTMEGVLPPEIIHRKKQGFGVPIGTWFRTELSDLVNGILLAPRSIERGYFDPGSLARLVDEHIAGRVDHGARIWALLNLELWHRTYIDRGSFGQPIYL